MGYNDNFGSFNNDIQYVIYIMVINILYIKRQKYIKKDK